MKIKYMLLALLPLCLASCSEEETIVSGGNQKEVRVTAGVGAHSRMVLNDKGQYTQSLWQNGDEISLFTSTQGDLVYRTTLDEHAATAEFAPMGEALQYIEGNEVYACYPTAQAIGEGNQVVKLSPNGSFDYNDGTVRSFCYAVDKISKGNLNFKFKHISAFISLNVTPEMLGGKSLSNGKIMVSTSSTTPLTIGDGDYFDFTTQTATTVNGGNSLVMTMGHVKDSLGTVYLPVLPQPAGADITITLVDSEGNAIYTQTKQTPASGFLAGNVYKLDASASFEVAYLVDGPTFNQSIKGLVSGGSPDDYLIGKVQFVTESYQVPEYHVVVSAEGSQTPIYASFNQADSLLTISTAAKRMEIEDASRMFYNFLSLRTIDFGNFEINETTVNTYLMFGNCSSLTTLDVSQWNTSRVVYMSGMFLDCSSLSSLDVSQWNTSQVTNMSSMFLGCSSLSSLNVSNWDTGQVTNMSGMFDNCFSLSSLNVSNWDTGQVTNMSGMFGQCSSLTTLDVSAWDVSQVTNMSGMFGQCPSLTTLDVSAWDVSQVTDMLCMFFNCSSLTALDILTWNTGQVTDMSCMFEGCSSLSSLDLSKWNTAQVTSMSGMFDNCSSLVTLNVFAWDVSQVTNMLGMFDNCSSLTALDLSTWNVNQVTNMSGMFYNCSSLTMLNLLDWDFNDNIIIRSMFENCASTSQACKVVSTKETKESLLDNTETTKMNPDWFIWEVDGEVADVAYLVDGMSFNALIKQLASGDPNRSRYSDDYLIQRIEFVGESSVVPADYIVVSTEASPAPIYASFNPVDSLLIISTAAKRMEIVDASYMFYNCSSLESLDLSNFDTSNVTSMTSMFRECSSLLSLDLSSFDTSNVSSMSEMFYGCSSLSSLDLSNFDTSNVIYMKDMFYGCSSLSSLDLSSFDTSNVTFMTSMFSDCSSLSSLDLSNFDMGHVTSMGYMFSNCAATSKACRVTSTKDLKDFLLGKTGTTYMNPDWFIWGDAENNGSGFGDMSKEEW